VQIPLMADLREGVMFGRPMSFYKTFSKSRAAYEKLADAMEKHKIPAKLRNRLSKSISDDEDPDEAIANLKQDLITDGLMTENEEGSKAASEKQVDEAADDLLKSITAK